MSLPPMRGLLVLSLALGVESAAPCRVLSLSGGGSFGAFEAGVLSRLVDEQPGLDYDYVMGISAGALNAGLLATVPVGPAGFKSGVDLMTGLWWNTTTGQVWRPRLEPLKGEPSLLSVDPLKKTMARVLDGRTVVRKVTLGSTSLATGASALHDEDEVSRNLTTLMRASSAIPVLFPPVEYNGARHVDGGTTANGAPRSTLPRRRRESGRALSDPPPAAPPQC